MDEILFDQFHHLAPTTFVCRERLSAARKRNLIEAGSSGGQHNTVLRILQRKDDECSRLAGVIDARLNGERMLSEREQPLGLHLLDGNFKWHTFVLLLSIGDLGIDRCRHNDSAHAGAGKRTDHRTSSQTSFRTRWSRKSRARLVSAAPAIESFSRCNPCSCNPLVTDQQVQR